MLNVYVVELFEILPKWQEWLLIIDRIHILVGYCIFIF